MFYVYDDDISGLDPWINSVPDCGDQVMFLLDPHLTSDETDETRAALTKRFRKVNKYVLWEEPDARVTLMNLPAHTTSIAVKQSIRLFGRVVATPTREEIQPWKQTERQIRARSVDTWVAQWRMRAR